MKQTRISARIVALLFIIFALSTSVVPTAAFATPDGWASAGLSSAEASSGTSASAETWTFTELHGLYQEGEYPESLEPVLSPAWQAATPTGLTDAQADALRARINQHLSQGAAEFDGENYRSTLDIADLSIPTTVSTDVLEQFIVDTINANPDLFYMYPGVGFRYYVGSHYTSI